MIRAAILFAAFLLAACSTTAAGLKPEAKILTQTVRVAVPTPCAKANDVEKPAGRFMSYAEVRAAVLADLKGGNSAAAVKTITGQLLLWLEWGPQLEAVFRSCATPATVTGSQSPKLKTMEAGAHH